MIRAVLIDMDGVVRRWTPWGPDPDTGLTLDELHAVAFDEAVLRGAVTGETTADEWTEEIARRIHLTHGAPGRAAVRSWAARIGEVDDDTLAIVRELREVVPVALISNATTRLEPDMETLGLGDAFDAVINSSRVGVAKPDAGIFVHAAEQLGVGLDECLFVDDTKGHIEAAAKLGLRTVHFTGADELRRVLHGYGLVSLGEPVRTLELKIRTARAEDVAQLAELHQRTELAAYEGIFPPEAPVPTLEQLAARVRGALTAGIVFVAVVDTEIVGVVATGPSDLDESFGRISMFYVDPAYWHRGIGGRLYQSAIEHLRERGFETATLWVLERNERARGWYERLGWVATGDRKPVWEPGVDDLRYRLTSI